MLRTREFGLQPYVLNVLRAVGGLKPHECLVVVRGRKNGVQLKVWPPGVVVQPLSDL